MSAYICGTLPLIFNRMAEKAKRALLLPSGRKTAIEKAQSLKHDPLGEFQASVYRHQGDDKPTRLNFPSPAFKGVRIPRRSRCRAPESADRQAHVDQRPHANIYGRRAAHGRGSLRGHRQDPGHPDQGDRRDWCCEIELNYVKPTLTLQTVINLLAAGGIVVGIGDFRQEKGAGNYGQFRVAPEHDEEFARIKAHGGREAQDEALRVAEPVRRRQRRTAC